MRGLVVDWRDYDRRLQRGRADPAQGPHARSVEEWMLLRRRRRAGRLRHQLHVLADAPAPHRASPGCSPSSRSSAPRSTSRSPSTTTTSTVAGARSPGCRSTTQRERRPDMTTDEAPEGRPQASSTKSTRDVGRPDLRRHRRRRRPQRPGQRRVPRQGRAQDADPRAAPPRRRRGDHRGAPPGLLVHDLLVRAEPAAAGHHPGPRADQARLHAAADVDDLRARWRTATTCCSTRTTRRT